MKKITLLLVSSLAISTGIPSIGHTWGGTGHKFIARLAIRNLPLSSFQRLLSKHETWFAVSSSHPDRWRLRNDASEPSRHFLDTENFGVGTATSMIPTEFDKLLKLRTYDQLRSDGTVPWAIARVKAVLIKSLREKNWEDALVQAAYLSHYVADAHVPFHASSNYDGQLSVPSQRGIHSRFEEKMVERFLTFESLRTSPIMNITNPVKDVLSVLEQSLSFVPTILEADRKALASANSLSNEAYFDLFGANTLSIAKARIEGAGSNLASHLQSAWLEAGKPNIPEDIDMDDSWLPYAPAFGTRGVSALPIVSQEVQNLARSTVATISIDSNFLKKPVRVNIAFPAGYLSDGKRYPVIYLLHGAWGTYADWNSKTGIAAYTAARGFIVVMPDSNDNSWYNDSNGMGFVESYITKELVPYIDKQYKTIANRDGRALVGLSMGGYGALHLALEHNKLFCAAASLSGAVAWGLPVMDTGLAAMSKSLYPTDTEVQYAGDAIMPEVLKNVRKSHYEGPALYFDCGKDDFLIASNRELEVALLTHGIPHEYAEFEGAHTWTYWDTHVQDAFQFIKRHLRRAKQF